MDEGYIKLYRKMEKWEWYTDPNTKALFLDLILEANIRDRRFRNKEIKRGQVITSLERMSKRNGLTIRQTRTALEHLISSGDIDKQTTNRYSIITVLNYELYQDERQTTDKQETNNRQTNDNIRRKKEYKEVKNIIEEKNKKEEIEIQHKYLENPELNTLFIEFLEIRKKLKAVNTPRAIEMLINKLQEYPEEEAKEMIKQSMVNSWKGLFPLKKKNEEKRNYLEELYDEGNQ